MIYSKTFVKHFSGFVLLAALSLVTACRSTPGTRETPPAEQASLLAPGQEYSLADFVTRSRLALDLDSAERRDWILFQAGSNENPPIRLHAKRDTLKTPSTPPSTAHTNSKSASGAQPARVKSWIRSANVAKLHRLDDRELRAALRGLTSYEPLEALEKRLLDKNSCISGRLSLSLASKAEEFFPEKRFLDKALRLYTNAARCGTAEDSARGRYRAGILYVWQGQCAKALPHFSGLLDLEGGSEYLSRAAFWKLHCSRALGNETDVAGLSERLLRDHPFSFHNLLVNGRAADPSRQLTVQADSKVVARSKAAPALNAQIELLEGYIAVRKPAAARIVLEGLTQGLTGDSAVEPEFRLYVAYLANRVDDYLAKFRLLGSLLKENPRLISKTSLALYYPRKRLSLEAIRSSGLSEFLVLSLIRQESAFDERATSIAGARGLMQVLPSTARQIEPITAEELYDPALNVRIGSKYFADLIQQYGGNVELALAAYNAGPHRIQNWVKRYPNATNVLFLDLIPFKETREYVASIARNYYWYSVLYSGIEKEPAANAPSEPAPRPTLDVVFPAFGG